MRYSLLPLRSYGRDQYLIQVVLLNNHTSGAKPAHHLLPAYVRVVAFPILVLEIRDPPAKLEQVSELLDAHPR